jgi:predicted enzyme related to lactoylglutathione lyase
MYGNEIGDMAWMDLSAKNAEQVKDFYSRVLGWKSDSVKMTNGEEAYVDYSMSNPQESDENSSGGFVTGICHAKGANEDMPAVWLPYFLVGDIEKAVATVNAEGGKLVTLVKSMGDDKYVVIKDPSGAQCALYQKSSS